MLYFKGPKSGVISRCLLVALTALAAPAALADGPKSAKPAADSLSDAEFERIHAKLSKMSAQRVWSIPWQLSVRKARELAARENKPVFLWISSNGGTHPLGPC